MAQPVVVALVCSTLVFIHFDHYQLYINSLVFQISVFKLNPFKFLKYGFIGNKTKINLLLLPFSLLVCFYYHQVQNKFIFYLHVYPLAACRLSAFLISLGCRLITSFLNIPGLQADYQFSNNHCVVG